MTEGLLCTYLGEADRVCYFVGNPEHLEVGSNYPRVGNYSYALVAEVLDIVDILVVFVVGFVKDIDYHMEVA